MGKFLSPSTTPSPSLPHSLPFTTSPSPSLHHPPLHSLTLPFTPSPSPSLPHPPLHSLTLPCTPSLPPLHSLPPSSLPSAHCVGEDVSPASSFEVSSYPQFLSTVNNEYQVATIVDVPPKPSQPTFVPGVMPTATSSSKKVASTPDLYGNPLVGKAMASSTPVPRSLAFTAGSTEADVSSLGQLPAGGRVVKEGVSTLARIKTQLSYSSSAEVSKVRPRHLTPGAAQSLSPHLPR